MVSGRAWLHKSTALLPRPYQKHPQICQGSHQAEPHHRACARQARIRAVLRRGLRPAEAHPVRPILDVEVANEVTLAFRSTDEEIQVQHYAFLVDEAEFDQIFGRVKARGLDYWADPAHRHKGEINHNDGGRGVYFDDPAGH